MTEEPGAKRPPPLELDGRSEPPGRAPRAAPRPILLRPRQLSMRARWVLSLSVMVALLVALVRFVNANTADPPIADNAAVRAESNREAEILVAHDQVPHTAALKAGIAPARGIRAAVAGDLRRRIAGGQIDGPLTRTRCVALAGGAQARQPFRCRAVAASVGYDFLGVVDERARRIVYCRSDPPPVPSVTVPVSRRCRV